MQTILKKLAHVPAEPGVYLLKDEHRQVLYVGKAKKLKARLSSYFAKNRQNDIKTKTLVKQIADFEIFLVHTEVEALLLERTLIRDHNPKFNILLRDDKEYPLVQIDYQNQWPRIRKVRKRESSEAAYLGPYGSVTDLNLILERIFEVFPLVRCSEYEFRTRKRPCAYYHMKKCLAPCTQKVEQSVYREIVQNAQKVLEGNNKDVLRDLRARMKNAAEEQNYELATIYRDQILAFKKVGGSQSVVIAPHFEGDIIGYTVKEDWVGIHLLLLRDGKIIGNNHFNLKNPLADKEACLEAFIGQYFSRHDSAKTIIAPFLPDNAKALATSLLSQDVTIRLAEAAEEKKLVVMACKNAHYGLEEFLRQKTTTESKLSQLRRELGLKRVPKTIECLDISHIQGTATVGSIVRFDNGIANKQKYRLYNIADEAVKIDDYQSIYEVLSRRLRRGLEEHDLPDLIMIDGGLGQLNAAIRAKEEYPGLDFELISIAKSRLKKDSAAIYHSPERIFTPESKEGIALVPASFTFQILTQLRDEAHRFAITQHRRRRQVVRHSSVLDQIHGLGPKTKQKLFAHFGDIEGIGKATSEELSALPGVSAALAERIVAFFREQNNG